MSVLCVPPHVAAAAGELCCHKALQSSISTCSPLTASVSRSVVEALVTLAASSGGLEPSPWRLSR